MKSIVALAALVVVAGCSTVKAPAKRSLSEFGLAIKHVKPAHETDIPKIVLSDSVTGASLAEAKSIFTPEAVAIFGMPPEQDRFRVLVSPSGRTVAVHENVSDASPEERITLFQKGTANVWQVRAVLPPYKDPSPPPPIIYGTYGTSLSVDDDSLYYRFGEDGAVRKTSLNALEKALSD
ncbi:MAG: hypothetical protein RL088_3002 [Verrucomicrobiota bacterium]|jgi:hypothetical protein